MNINDVGSTAFLIAYFRMLEGQRAQSLFTDPYAAWFVPDAMREKGEQFRALLPEAVELVRCRCYFFNDLLRREIEAGTTQVVIVGSGFDMRPRIFQTDGVRFFDVDQPTVLDYKYKILEQHDMPPFTGVPCNYLDVRLPDHLVAAGFDLAAPTLFIWEGNTMYLPVDLVYGFLNQLADAVESFHIGFDYLTTAVINRTTGIERMTHTVDFFADKIGAPWVTGFDDPTPLTSHTPLHVIESGSMDSLSDRYAPHDVDADALASFANLYAFCVLGTASQKQERT